MPFQNVARGLDEFERAHRSPAGQFDLCLRKVDVGPIQPQDASDGEISGRTSGQISPSAPRGAGTLPRQPSDGPPARVQRRVLIGRLACKPYGVGDEGARARPASLSPRTTAAPQTPRARPLATPPARRASVSRRLPVATSRVRRAISISRSSARSERYVWLTSATSVVMTSCLASSSRPWSAATGCSPAPTAPPRASGSSGPRSSSGCESWGSSGRSRTEAASPGSCPATASP